MPTLHGMITAFGEGGAETPPGGGEGVTIVQVNAAINTHDLADNAHSALFSAVNTRIDNIETNMSGMSDAMSDAQSDMATMSDSMSVMSNDVSAMSANMIDVTSDMDTMQTTVSSLSGTVYDQSTDITNIKNSINAIDGEISTINSDITTIEGGITTINNRITAIDSIHAVYVSGVQNFNLYLTAGVWEFDAAAHTNGPPYLTGTTVAGGILRITTSRSPVMRIFQEYMIWYQGAQQSLVYTRGYNVETSTWGSWRSNATMINVSASVNVTPIPTVSLPYTMPFNGCITAQLYTNLLSGVTTSSLNVTGGITLLTTAWETLTSAITIQGSTPILPRGTTVWVVGSANFVRAIPLIGG